MDNTHSSHCTGIIPNPKSIRSMKYPESKELRNLSMMQLNARLSELYGNLKDRYLRYNKRYQRHTLQEIGAIKYEQTLRRKGLRTQGIWVETGPFQRFGGYTGRFHAGGKPNTSNVPKEATEIALLGQE